MDIPANVLGLLFVFDLKVSVGNRGTSLQSVHCGSGTDVS